MKNRNNNSGLVNMKKALIAEGGAMRGIFSCGVLDSFLDNNYNPFDFCIGVSAGATNLAAWMCSQRGRNYKVYTDYSCRPQFISFKKYLLGGHALDLDWLWENTIRDIRLDLDTFSKQQIPFYIGTTNSVTGKAEYYEGEAETLEQLIKASSALPVMYRGYPEYKGIPMSDGGISDSIPVIKAYETGARDITFLFARPAGYRKKPGRFPFLTDFMLKDKPALAKAMKMRSAVYNRTMDFIDNPPEDCIMHVIAPPEGFDVGRTTKNRAKLDAGYEMGLEAGREFCRKHQ